MTSTYTEETLVQQTTAEYLESELGWESICAYNNEDFGSDSLLGRTSDREVVLKTYITMSCGFILRCRRRSIRRRQGHDSWLRILVKPATWSSFLP